MLDDVLSRQGAAVAARGYTSLEWGGMVVRCVLGSDKGKCCCRCAFQLRLHCSDGEPRHEGRLSDKNSGGGGRKEEAWALGLTGSSTGEAWARRGDRGEDGDVTMVTAALRRGRGHGHHGVAGESSRCWPRRGHGKVQVAASRMAVARTQLRAWRSLTWQGGARCRASPWVARRRERGARGCAG